MIRFKWLNRIKRKVEIFIWYFSHAQIMSWLALWVKIVVIELIWLKLNLFSWNYLQSHFLKCLYFVGIVSEKNKFGIDLHHTENIFNGRILPVILLHSQITVGHESVNFASGKLLNHTGPTLADVATASSLLDQVKQNSVLLLGDLLQRVFQLLNTVAVQRT